MLQIYKAFVLLVPDFFSSPDSPVIKELKEQFEVQGCEVHVLHLPATVDAAVAAVEEAAEGCGPVKIGVGRDLEEYEYRDRPDLLVAIGSSVLLCGGVKDMNKVFIDPDYCTYEWLELRLRNQEKIEEDRNEILALPPDEYVVSKTDVAKCRQLRIKKTYSPRHRFVEAIFTDSDDHNIAEHEKLYSSAAIYEPGRLDNEAGIARMAKFIVGLYECKE